MAALSGSPTPSPSRPPSEHKTRGRRAHRADWHACQAIGWPRLRSRSGLLLRPSVLAATLCASAEHVCAAALWCVFALLQVPQEYPFDGLRVSRGGQQHSNSNSGNCQPSRAERAEHMHASTQLFTQPTCPCRHACYHRPEWIDASVSRWREADTFSCRRESSLRRSHSFLRSIAFPLRCPCSLSDPPQSAFIQLTREIAHTLSADTRAAPRDSARH